MSRVTLSPGIDIWRGKVSGKSGMTMRIKSYRDDEGHIIKMGPQEYYRKDKRDFKVHPRSAAEEAQRQFWQTVCRAASAIVKDKEHPRYAELRARWNAQFKGGCDAFLNEGQEVKKIYGMFPVFVRMVLMKEMKSEN
ncbi:MAG: hypothetical protein J5884_04395 [Paludibacteraceae bacterium]|nr:hypothetical protein [Paludibacteraceae bacterium]